MQRGTLLCRAGSGLEGEGGENSVRVPLCCLLQPADSLLGSGIQLQVCACTWQVTLPQAAGKMILTAHLLWNRIERAFYVCLD